MLTEINADVIINMSALAAAHRLVDSTITCTPYPFTFLPVTQNPSCDIVQLASDVSSVRRSQTRCFDDIVVM